MNIKDLEKLIKLCNRSGVTSIKIEGVELTLDTARLPLRPSRLRKTYSPASVEEALRDEGPTEEELLYWSSPADLPEPT